MNTTLRILATPGKYAAFHSLALAIILTGVLILLSASELGTVQIFMVPLGLYAVFMGVCCELLFGLRFLIAFFARYIQNRIENRNMQ